MLDVVEVDFFKEELDRLETARDNSIGVDSLVRIVQELYALDVPIGLVYNSFSSPDLMTDLNDIDVGPIATIGGSGRGGNEDYKNSILNWQNSHIAASISAREFAILRTSIAKEIIFNVYSVDVSSSSSEESYFVINKPMEDLFFKEDVGARKVDDATVIILEGNGRESFSFYYEGGDGVSFFVSPKLSSIVIGKDIDKGCNFNFACEDNEDYKSCRSDCKPVGRAIAYSILIFVGILIFYALLQVWYKRRYETYLFKDRRHLYNLLMYVTNARARGASDSEIRAELKKKGWSRERVNYVIKKSRGKRAGMFEIIPFGKITAYIRNRKARRGVTEVRQQIGRNINKSGFQ